MKNTRHSKERVKNRMGISGKGTERQLVLAKERGVGHEKMKGQLKKWADSVVFKTSKRPYVLAYNGHLFLVDQKMDKLITVLPIPNNIMRIGIERFVKN